MDLPCANTALIGHIKYPTLGEVPLINPLVKAHHWPRKGIVGDWIDKCINWNQLFNVLVEEFELRHATDHEL